MITQEILKGIIIFGGIIVAAFLGLLLGGLWDEEKPSEKYKPFFKKPNTPKNTKKNI